MGGGLGSLVGSISALRFLEVGVELVLSLPRMPGGSPVKLARPRAFSASLLVVVSSRL